MQISGRFTIAVHVLICIEMFKNDKNAILIITHNTKILHSLKVDFVHVLVNGQIVKTGNQELAKEIEENGYAKYK